MQDAPAARPSFPWWVFAGAVLLPLVYLPTLGTRFDFIDDGNLVYPAPAMSTADRLHRVWERIEANYDHLGPFRPVLWVHWEAFADLFQGNDYAWRATRYLWCCLAAGAFLWLLHELRVPAVAALPAVAAALWNPFRGEIWTSLTLAEGVAMPYALVALAAARRARRSERPWLWDIVSVVGVLAALGCKNTFAALVPAQLLLRTFPDGSTLRAGLKQNWRRALLLSLTLLLPAAHYVYFQTHWHPGQYRPAGPSWAQFQRIVSALRGAITPSFLGLALLAAAVALTLHAGAWRAGLLRYRIALAAGGALIVGGVVLYLPMEGMSGRYTLPAAWGLDLAIAALFGSVAALPLSQARRVAFGALWAGLVGVGISSVGKQEKFAARADLLWQALEYAEANLPPDARLGWIASSIPAWIKTTADELNVEEGIHVQWHLQQRGRRPDLKIGLCDEQGQPQPRCELPQLSGSPTALLTGGRNPGPGWTLAQRFESRFWAGHKSYGAALWLPE